MNLTVKPDVITVPAQHYLFVEKIGPFHQTAQAAWQELHSKLVKPNGAKENVGAMALFKMEPQMIYRAGFTYSERPKEIPAGFHYIEFDGGKYSKFTLTGSYSQLPEAWGRVMDLVKELKISVRDDFYIESYANDPRETPADQLISELMIPTK